MPEEDDDALGQMLGDRLKGTKAGSAADSSGDSVVDPAPETDAGDEAERNASTGTAGAADDTESTQITESTNSAQSSESTDVTESTQRTSNGGKATTEAGSGADTVRSRSPFPLYVTPELKATVQGRFEKFNAQRTLNDEPQVEKHKHFMEALLRAGLDHPELEEYVLEEFED